MRGLLLALVILGCLAVGNGFFFSSLSSGSFANVTNDEEMAETTAVTGDDSDYWKRLYDDDFYNKGWWDTSNEGSWWNEEDVSEDESGSTNSKTSTDQEEKGEAGKNRVVGKKGRSLPGKNYRRGEARKNRVGDKKGRSLPGKNYRRGKARNARVGGRQWKSWKTRVNFLPQKTTATKKSLGGKGSEDDVTAGMLTRDALRTSAYRPVTEQLLQLVNDSYLGMLQLPQADMDNVTDHWVNRTVFAVHLVTQFKAVIGPVENPPGYDEVKMRRYYMDMKRSWERMGGLGGLEQDYGLAVDNARPEKKRPKKKFAKFYPGWGMFSSS